MQGKFEETVIHPHGYRENRWFSVDGHARKIRKDLERYRPLVARSGKTGNVDLGLTLYNIHGEYRFITYEESVNLLAFIHGVGTDDGRLLTTERYVAGQEVHRKIVERSKSKTTEMETKCTKQIDG